MADMKPNSAPDSRLTKNVEISTLSAFYGRLLTEKQREALEMHYGEDLSLGEIAGQFGVSRQNVHDLITRSAQKLERYEQAVGGVAQAQQAARQLREAVDALTEAKKALVFPRAHDFSANESSIKEAGQSAAVETEAGETNEATTFAAFHVAIKNIDRAITLARKTINELDGEEDDSHGI